MVICSRDNERRKAIMNAEIPVFVIDCVKVESQRMKYRDVNEESGRAKGGERKKGVRDGEPIKM
jgi:hypothetical protein